MSRGFVTREPIKAGRAGQVPVVINLLKAGAWNTPWHGDFELTGDDFLEMVTNFEQGIALVDQDREAPINYFHEGEKLAAGWMKSLFVEPLDGVQALMANVEWTPAGEQNLRIKRLSIFPRNFILGVAHGRTPSKSFHLLRMLLMAQLSRIFH